MKHITLSLILTAGLLFSLLSCDDNKPENRQISHIARTDWAEDVRDGINAFMDDNAWKENGYVVFDFDNTCSIFDVEEQMIVYQIQTMSFAMNPADFKTAISTGLESIEGECQDWISDISTAYEYLYDSYGPFTPSGLDSSWQQTIHDDPYWLEFAAKTRAFYDKMTDWVSTEVNYTWILYLFCGMTEDEIYQLSYRSNQFYSQVSTTVETWTSPSEIQSKLGQISVSWTSGIQVSQNIIELWKVLYENGIDVWVCSASGVPQIMGAVDFFGMHDYCTGLVAMTVTTDASGRQIPQYDFSTGYGKFAVPGGWKDGTIPTKALTQAEGKVTAILNSIAPLYGGEHPLAGFMDSSGDFNFCTEFSSLKMVICFNRANRKITDGGGLIAEVAIYQKENLGFDYYDAIDNGDTFYLLQGRDENGMRCFRASNKTLRYGSTEEKLFANEDNYAQLQQMIDNQMTTSQAINTFSINISSSDKSYHALSCTVMP